jgi:hypothetical protein
MPSSTLATCSAGFIGVLPKASKPVNRTEFINYSHVFRGPQSREDDLAALQSLLLRIQQPIKA